MTAPAECPRKRSSMTPCVVTDGPDAADDGGECVGCGVRVGLASGPTPPSAPTDREQDNRAQEVGARIQVLESRERYQGIEPAEETILALSIEVRDLLARVRSLQRERDEATAKARERAAQICESRARTLRPTEANEAGKCAAAIRSNGANLLAAHHNVSGAGVSQATQPESPDAPRHPHHESAVLPVDPEHA